MKSWKIALGCFLFTASPLLAESPGGTLNPYQQELWRKNVRYNLIPPETVWRFWARYDYTSTDTNIDRHGGSAPLAGNASVDQHQVFVGADYALTDKLLLSAELEYRYLSAQTQPGSAQNELDAFGITNVEVGARYSILKEPKFQLAGELKLLVPTYNSSNTNYNTDLLLGSGSTDFTAQALARRIMGRYALWGNFGYRHRSDGFSADLPYAIGYRKEEGDFLFGAKFHGYYSLNTDSFDAPNQGLSGQVPSNLHNAANPSIHMLGVHAGFTINENIAVEAHFNRPIAGQNAWEGNNVGLQLHYFPAFRTEAITIYPREFREYSLEARITQVSSRVNFVKINKGERDTVRVGQAFEIYDTEDGRSGAPVAFARVLSVESSAAVLKILRYYREVLVDEGMTAKRVLSPDS